MVSVVSVLSCLNARGEDRSRKVLKSNTVSFVLCRGVELGRHSAHNDRPNRIECGTRHGKSDAGRSSSIYAMLSPWPLLRTALCHDISSWSISITSYPHVRTLGSSLSQQRNGQHENRNCRAARRIPGSLDDADLRVFHHEYGPHLGLISLLLSIPFNLVRLCRLLRLGCHEASCPGPASTQLAVRRSSDIRTHLLHSNSEIGEQSC